jgi:hypothetical protein
MVETSKSFFEFQQPLYVISRGTYYCLNLRGANVLEPNSAVDDWLKHDETPVLATFFSLL